MKGKVLLDSAEFAPTFINDYEYLGRKRFSTMVFKDPFKDY